MRSKIFGLTLIFVVFIGILLFVALSFFAERNFTQKKAPVPETVNNSVTYKTEEKTKYFITLEDNSLCAYKEDGGKRTLIHSKKVDAMPVDGDDITKLENGIYAETYEDMVLCFESYLN